MSDHLIHRPPSRRLLIVGAILLTLAVAIAILGIVTRTLHAKVLDKEVEDRHTTVEVVTPVAGPSEQPLVLPGNVRANIEATIYSRVPGYLKMWYTDIGAHVKKGQLMAEVETPELDQQILRERANLLTAQSNLEIADLTAKRWQNLLATNSVSRQETDEKVADARAKEDIAHASAANLKSLTTQQLFNRITAPFDGIVTERNTDIGKLINPGSSNGQALFQVADNRKLRIYVDVPQSFSADINPGLKAELHFPEHPSKVYSATVVSTSQAIHESSRTLTTELQMPNDDGEVLPGTYAEVHFALSAHANVYRLPASTLLFRKEGLQVAAVESDNHVRLKNITLGRDLGGMVEVTSGVDLHDRVIESPSDSILQGNVVRIKPQSAVSINTTPNIQGAPAP
jgi:RND family efflux transporter MFP subunit